MKTIKLVQNDTAPDIDFTLIDGQTGGVINVSQPSDIVRFYFRKVGSSTIKATIVATKPNGGADGVVRITWPPGALDTPGEYEGEIEITFASGKKHTVTDVQRFTIRQEIG